MSPTYFRTILPDALISFASLCARWSAPAVHHIMSVTSLGILNWYSRIGDVQRMMSRLSFPVPHSLFVTDIGVPFLSVTANEHVASKPIPFTSSLLIFESLKTSLLAFAMEFQIYSERDGKCQARSRHGEYRKS